MRFPGRKELAAHAYVTRGEEIRADTSRHGVVDDGNVSWPERVREARRLWIQADPADFEQLDQNGRRWRDRATGDEFRAIGGAPLLSGPEACRGAQCFFVKDNRIVVLRKADFPVELHGPVGNIYSQQLTPENPGPELRIR